MEASDILPDDIKKVFIDASNLKKSYNETRLCQVQLQDNTKLLQKELALSRENEMEERSKADSLMKELVKLQASLADLSETKRENMTWKDKITEYKTQVSELTECLEKERLSCHEMMQKSRKEFEELAVRNFNIGQNEVKCLRDQLLLSEEQLEKRTTDLQAKVNDVQVSKNDEIKQLTYTFQEKINKLQSALTATQTENRNILDRLQFNTASYQKKIQELERRNQLHPALRTNPLPNKAVKSAPRLCFIAPDMNAELKEYSEAATRSTDNPPDSLPTNQAKKRRKLFVQKNTPE